MEHESGGQVWETPGNSACCGQFQHLLFPVSLVAAGGHTRRSKARGGSQVEGENSLSPNRSEIPIPASSNTGAKPTSLKRSRLRTCSSKESNLMKRVRFNFDTPIPASGSLPVDTHNSLSASDVEQGAPKETSHPAAFMQTTSGSEVPHRIDNPSVVPGEPTEPNQLNSDHNYDRLFDELFARIRTNLLYDEKSSTADKRKVLELEVENSLYWYHGRLYIPESKDNLREDLMYWHHDVPWCAHLGVEKTVKLLKHQFWWPGMDTDIRNYISTCNTCQGNKTDRTNRRLPLVPLSPPDACWQTLGVDLIVNLPKTREGYNTICVFVCHLSKMVRLVPTDYTLDAIRFAKMFFREIFPHYGMPRKIVSDRGSQWNNEFFQEVCKLAGIHLSLSTAYHP